jgi:hypothetical protein
MVLRETLVDADIPCRDKMREAIISRWRKLFEELKDDLSVSYYYYFSPTLQTDVDQSSIAISRANQFYG